MKSISAQSDTDGRIPIASYFGTIERGVFVTYLAAMLIGTLTFHEIENLVGTDLLGPILEYLKASWPKFAAESAFLESTNSKYLGPYYFAQIVFPLLAVLLIPLCHFRIQSKAVITGSKKFVWRGQGLLYVAIVAAIMTYIVFFYVMDLEQGAIGLMLFRSDLFYIWLPLIYTAITSLVLRTTLLVGTIISRLGE